MSFLARIFPFLFEEPIPDPAKFSAEILAKASPEQKKLLIGHRSTPGSALVTFSRDPDSDIRILLAKRLSQLLPKVKSSDAQTAKALLEAIQHLTEDSVTPVRVALASALKDVANLPPMIARRLADDAERAVAEPIIRYSLGLSDDDLLELIAQHPQDWHVVTIAQRARLGEPVTDSLVGLENRDVSETLLGNDSARISQKSLTLIGKNPLHAASLKRRNSLNRRLKRDFSHVAENTLYSFLRQKANLDNKTTHHVLQTIHQRIDTQQHLSTTPPAELSESQLRDMVVLGENVLVLRALAARAKTDTDTIRRMVVESGAAKPVIALCVKAGLSMSFSVLLQQRLARLPPAKIHYPKNGDECPITPEEIQWQLEFFGI